MARALPVVSIVCAVVLAGCVGVALESDGGRSEAGEPTSSLGGGARTGKFCNGPSGCRFWDDVLHEYVLYTVDTAKIDVLIVPPGSPFAVRDTKSMEQSVKAWGVGIDALAAPWLADAFEINQYVVGEDLIPDDAVTDPEIIVVGAEFNPVLLFGIGYQLPNAPCRPGERVLSREPVHEHDGMRILQADCERGGRTCMALNTNFLLGGQRRMYDLISHEVGHCLGVGHVGDALDFKAKTVPLDDIMSYQHDPSHVHCVSSLNVKGIEGVYARVLGRPSSEWRSAGTYYSMDPSEYVLADCHNPHI